MDESLRQAVLGAGNIQAPASTLGASQAPELAAMALPDFQLPVSGGATSILSAQAGDIVEQQKKAAALAEKKKKDLADVNNYKIVRKDDGGYDYFDPDGNQVDIATLAERTGAKPSDLVKDSENPIDKQYMEDYNNLQEYLSALINKDKETLDAIRSERPELSKYDSEGGQEKLIQDFKNYYKRYYTTREKDPEAWGVRPNSNTFVPNRQVAVGAYDGGSGIGE